MPDQVGGQISGIRPTLARGEDVQANRTAHTSPQAVERQQDQVDRVEISEAGRARNQELSAANNPQTPQRGAAAEAPGAQAPEEGEQGNMEQATANNAARLREQEEASRQQQAENPPEQQGNLVDLRG